MALPEEDDEGVSLREAEEDDGEVGGDGAVEHGGADLGEGVGHALPAGRGGHGSGSLRSMIRDRDIDHLREACKDLVRDLGQSLTLQHT